MIAWQLLLGVGTNVLIVLLTARYFGFTAAFCARLPATLYAPFVHYEKLLLRLQKGSPGRPEVVPVCRGAN